MDSKEDQGPPEDEDIEGGNQQPPNLHSNGFVPNLHISAHEIDQLREPAQAPPDVPVLSIPVVQ